MGAKTFGGGKTQPIPFGHAIFMVGELRRPTQSKFSQHCKNQQSGKVENDLTAWAMIRTSGAHLIAFCMPL
jgi:hypothetical protein